MWIYSSLGFCLLQVLSLSPAGEVTLQALGGRCVVELLWAPRRRVPPFTAQLRAECMGMLRPLLTAHGSCQVNILMNQYV